MFLAIINDTYAEVKMDVKSRKADFQIGDFFKTGVNNVKCFFGILDRYIEWKWFWNVRSVFFITQLFHFYRGIDVENAIKLAAADDGYVTYDELRENLRK